jgi:hypothetical protein
VVPEGPGAELWFPVDLDPADLEGVEMAIRIIHPLRFGNAVVQLLNALALARRLGVRDVIAAPCWFLSKGETRLSEGRRLIHFGDDLVGYQSALNSHPIRLEGLFLFASEFDPLLSSDAVSRELDDLKTALVLELEPQALSDRHLVVHIRSGDIFDPVPHPSYGQPPLAFYLSVLGERDWDEVSIVCEDDLNPVVRALERSCRERGVPCSIVSGELASDVAYLLRARKLVAGTGTFMPAVVALSHNTDEVFAFEQEFHPLGDRRVRTWILEDKAGEYRKRIMNGNWMNTVEQRELMLNYRAESLAIRQGDE